MSNLKDSLSQLKVVEKILSSNMNIQEMPAIEFDIVMSKLRGIYEDLLASRNEPIEFGKMCAAPQEEVDEVVLEPMAAVAVAESEEENVSDAESESVEFEPLEDLNVEQEAATEEAPKEVVFEIQSPIIDLDADEEQLKVEEDTEMANAADEVEEVAVPATEPQSVREEPQKVQPKAIDPMFDDIDNDIIEQLYGQSSVPKEVPVISVPQPETVATPVPEPEVVLTPEPAREFAPEPTPAPQPAVEPQQPRVQSPLAAEKRVLGEVLRSDAEVLNATLGGNVQRDLATKIVSGTDLRSQIGINDRFMFIRELFNNNESLYEQTLNDLNKETDLNEALIYIGENFRWRGDSHAAQQFINMLMKKLS